MGKKTPNQQKTPDRIYLHRKSNRSAMFQCWFVNTDAEASPVGCLQCDSLYMPISGQGEPHTSNPHPRNFGQCTNNEFPACSSGSGNISARAAWAPLLTATLTRGKKFHRPQNTVLSYKAMTRGAQGLKLGFTYLLALHQKTFHPQHFKLLEIKQ